MHDRPLSFSRYGADGSLLNGWDISDLGEWERDVARGRDAALELTTMLKETDNVPLFCRVIMDAVVSDPERKSGAVTGLLSHIGDDLRLAMVHVR